MWPDIVTTPYIDFRNVDTSTTEKIFVSRLTIDESKKVTRTNEIVILPIFMKRYVYS